MAVKVLASYSINALHDLTGVDRRTIKKRLEKLSPAVKDGVGGEYDAKKALPLIYQLDAENTKEQEQLRKLTLEADLLLIEKDKAQRKLLPVNLVAQAWESICVGIRSKILRSKLPEKDKEVILTELRTLSADEYLSEGEDE